MQDEQTGVYDEACCIPEYNACCCTCKHRLTDFHHCTTTGQCGNKTAFAAGEPYSCVCSKPRGYICAVGLAFGPTPEHPTASPIRGIHSGWSEHGMCEMHECRETLGQKHMRMLKALDKEENHE